MKRLLFFLLAYLIVNPIAQADTVVAAANPWPPFLDPDHPQEGVAIEIVREAYKREGYDLEMNFVPWARAMDGVKKAKYDIIPDAWWSEKRTEFLAFSQPYLANQVKFIKRKDDAFEYNRLDDLSGKSVGVIRDYSYDDAFMSSTDFSRPEATNLIQNVKKLTSGRIDLTLEDEIVARHTIASSNSPELIEGIAFTKTPLSKKELYVTSGLENPRHKELIEAFNRGLASMKADGTFDKILSRNKLN